MGLVSAKEMLDKAKAGHYAVGQFNINNLEWTKSILLTAEELKAPVILGVSEGAAKYMTGFTTVSAMVSAMVDALGITVPVALHLDHGSYEGAKKALDAGFSSIMFDGSHYGIEENIEKTKEMVELCHAKGVSVEAEVGSIGGEEDGVVGAGEVADPKECKMIADLGVDFLAAGIGNIHGKYPENWAGLDFNALDAIQQETGTLRFFLIFALFAQPGKSAGHHPAHRIQLHLAGHLFEDHKLDRYALLGIHLLMFADVIGLKARRMQIVDQIAHLEITRLKIRQRLRKQRHIIGLEPDFTAVDQKIAVLHQLSGMGQPALGILGAFGPGIAEVDINPLHAILRRKDLADILNIIARNHRVFDRLIAIGFRDIAARIAQHIAGDVHGNEIDVLIVIHHRRSGNAFAAAKLQMQRLIRLKQLAPMTAMLFRFIGEIRADGQLRLRPFLCAHMHGKKSSSPNKKASHA